MEEIVIDEDMELFLLGKRTASTQTTSPVDPYKEGYSGDDTTEEAISLSENMLDELSSFFVFGRGFTERTRVYAGLYECFVEFKDKETLLVSLPALPQSHVNVQINTYPTRVNDFCYRNLKMSIHKSKTPKRKRNS